MRSENLSKLNWDYSFLGFLISGFFGGFGHDGIDRQAVITKCRDAFRTIPESWVFLACVEFSTAFTAMRAVFVFLEWVTSLNYHFMISVATSIHIFRLRFGKCRYPPLFSFSCFEDMIASTTHIQKTIIQPLSRRFGRWFFFPWRCINRWLETPKRALWSSSWWWL